jgi:hypothetical protein
MRIFLSRTLTLLILQPLQDPAITRDRLPAPPPSWPLLHCCCIGNPNLMFTTLRGALHRLAVYKSPLHDRQRDPRPIALTSPMQGVQGRHRTCSRVSTHFTHHLQLQRALRTYLHLHLHLHLLLLLLLLGLIFRCLHCAAPPSGRRAGGYVQYLRGDGSQQPPCFLPSVVANSCPVARFARLMLLCFR